jgi:hypothetical protein
MAKASNEYVFEVHLKGARRISRTIAMRGDQTLDDLHEAIFVAFDRFDEHLYSFYFPRARRRRGTGPEPMESTAPQLLDDPWPLMTRRRFNAAASRLDRLRLAPGQTFEYLFDFGDCWWHEGAVVAVNRSDPAVKYPEIRASRGASPPQYPQDDE